RRGGAQLNRPRVALAEPVCGELRGAAARRTPRCRGVHQPARSPGAGRGLAHRGQHPPTPQRPRLPDPDRLRQGLDHHPPRTLIADGPTAGVQSLAFALAQTVAPALWTVAILGGVALSAGLAWP